MLSVSEIQDELTEAYGFPIPRLFAETTQLVLTFMEEGYEDTSEYLGWTFTPALHLFGSGKNRRNIAERYDQTPLEMFPFGWSGNDGEHYGYLVHAPELNQTDYPIVEFEPMSDFGVNLIGPDTRSGWEGLLSLIMESEYATALHKHDQLALALGLYPSAQKADWYKNRRTFIPPLPAGWRYEATSDGVGVLAPTNTFSPDHSPAFADVNQTYNLDIQLQKLIKMAQTSLAGGYPATALAVIRERYWQERGGDKVEQYASLWRQAYLDLSRPLLANAVESLLPQFRRTL